MRKANITRKTRETSIEITLNLEGAGEIKISSGLGFLDHMLQALSFYAGFDLSLSCRGDLEVDSHHSAEDIGLVLGEAFKEALGEKRGIRRFSSTITPMDESLALVAVDISNRPLLAENLNFNRESIGNLGTEDLKEFLRAFAMSSGITLHIDLMRGENDHHKAEAVFKGLGRALREAVEIVGEDVVSTKGML